MRRSIILELFFFSGHDELNPWSFYLEIVGLLPIIRDTENISTKLTFLFPIPILSYNGQDWTVRRANRRSAVRYGASQRSERAAWWYLHVEEA